MGERVGLWMGGWVSKEGWMGERVGQGVGGWVSKGGWVRGWGRGWVGEQGRVDG